jgi:hypothetical protein
MSGDQDDLVVGSMQKEMNMFRTVKVLRTTPFGRSC